jgi:hypothetical protein
MSLNIGTGISHYVSGQTVIILGGELKKKHVNTHIFMYNFFSKCFYPHKFVSKSRKGFSFYLFINIILSWKVGHNHRQCYVNDCIYLTWLMDTVVYCSLNGRLWVSHVSYVQ